MSILAKNIRNIRKELKCSQGAMAEILNVGFRTYVRYEAGERDAPVGVLVKLSKLGNLSLERLLTEEMKRYHLVPAGEVNSNDPLPQVRSCDTQKGTIKIKGGPSESLMTMDASEAKLLALFRKNGEQEQDDFLSHLNSQYKVTNKAVRIPRRKSVEKEKRRKDCSRVLDQAGSIKPDTERRPGKPGRKKLNRKSLREKITKLKTVTRSVPKTTVG